MSISAQRAGIALLLVLALTGFAATSRAGRRQPTASLRTQNAQPDAQPGAGGQATTQKPAGDDAGIVSDSEREDAIARAQVWRQPRTRIARATLTTENITTATCRFKMEALGGGGTILTAPDEPYTRKLGTHFLLRSSTQRTRFSPSKVAVSNGSLLACRSGLNHGCF